MRKGVIRGKQLYNSKLENLQKLDKLSEYYNHLTKWGTLTIENKINRTLTMKSKENETVNQSSPVIISRQNIKPKTRWFYHYDLWKNLRWPIT